MVLEDLEQYLPCGYSVEELTNNEKIIVDFFLTALDEVTVDMTMVDEESTLMEKMLAEIAEDILAEVKDNIISRASEIVVGLLDSRQ